MKKYFHLVKPKTSNNDPLSSEGNFRGTQESEE